VPILLTLHGKSGNLAWEPVEISSSHMYIVKCYNSRKAISNDAIYFFISMFTLHGLKSFVVTLMVINFRYCISGNFDEGKFDEFDKSWPNH